jgi:hypothetical protein
VVASFTLSQGKEAKQIHTPLSPSSKEKKIVLATIGLVLSLIF